MTFEDLLRDIETLKGKTLSCIAKGSDLVVKAVNWENERIDIFIVKSGKESSRSFAEFRRLWELLCLSPAVHVDSALAGSGSSRNQPETILANLPYVEYLYIADRKHLTLMPKKTHEPGTTLETDAILAQRLRAAIHKAPSKAAPPASVVIVDNIKQGVRALESLSGVTPEPVIASPGVYKLYKGNNRILIAERGRVNQAASPGSYAVVPARNAEGEPLGVEVDGYVLVIPTSRPLQLFIAREKD